MKKRLLALLLCLVMVIGLVPTVFAVDPEPTSSASTTFHICYLNGNTNLDYNVKVEKGKNLTVAQPFPHPSKKDFLWDGNWYYSFSPVTASTRPDSNYIWDFTWPISADAHDDVYLFPGYTANNVTEEDKYTVTFKNSDGAGSTEYTVEWDATLVIPSFEKIKSDRTAAWAVPAGKELAGWSLIGEEAGYSYSEGDPIANICANTVLEAIWRDATAKRTITYFDASTMKKETVTITANDSVYVNLNGGDSAKFVLADNTQVPVVPNTKSYTITNNCNLNYALKADNTPAIGWIYTPANKMFTAVWEKESYRVSFYCYNHGKNDYIDDVPYNTKLIIDPNGGIYAGSKAVQTVIVTSDRAIADPTRTGYTFYGWYVTESKEGVYTFTAVWNDNYYYNTYSIYYYDYDDCKSEYANFPYGTSVVIDPNGGTAKLSGTSFSTKQSFNIYRDYTLTDASRSGYTFYGWDLTKSGSTYYFTAMWSRYKSDVPYMLNGTDHYAYIKGYPNGSFKPTDTITRAEAATIFYRLLTDSTRKAYATTYNSFKDVPATAWYNTAVSTMAKLGIVNGGADGYFRPNDPITRAEIAAMIARCDGAYYTGTSTVFSDTYGHWAAGYIDRAYELGWINGYGTTYAPDRYISRAETVAVLNRVLNRAPQYTSDLTRNYTTFSDVATSAWYYLDVEEAANSHTYTRKSNADYETWTKLIADPSWF